jgi:glycosyltransferase involved in cell wall biosynthesis
MAVHNSAKHLEKSVLSILNQSFHDFEFIMINDGSTDESVKIIKKYLDKDNRIKIINNKKNIGLTMSLNKGLQIARGKYIARMDADDIALDNRFQLQYDFLEKNKDIFLVGGSEIFISEDGEPIKINKRLSNERLLLKALERGDSISHPTIMFRNQKGARYREKFRYAQDYDFILSQLSKHRRVINIPCPVLKYRMNPDSISLSKRAYQSLFAEKAKLFYKQRRLTGKDDYNSFNPEEIFKTDLSSNNQKLILEAQIESFLAKKEYEKVKLTLKKYFKYHGLFSRPKYFFCSIILFFSPKLMVAISNIVHTYRNIVYGMNRF